MKIGNCPNPECKVKNCLIENSPWGFCLHCSSDNGILISGCGYRSPHAETIEEAVRIHNLICQPIPAPSVSEAAEEAAIRILEAPHALSAPYDYAVIIADCFASFVSKAEEPK